LKKSVFVAYVAVFAALAIILTFSRAEIPFPILPYLKFDFAEIPVMLALFLGGLGAGLTAEIIHWIGLSLARGWVLGPLMKFLAVVSMVIGSWLGIKVLKGRSLRKTLAIALLLGIVFRVIVCAITNTVVLLWVAPEFLKFSTLCLRTAGFNAASESEALAVTLVFNAIYNALHVLLSSIVAYVILRASIKALPKIPTAM
jgi:riboflavin transporter FmnP